MNDQFERFATRENFSHSINNKQARLSPKHNTVTTHVVHFQLPIQSPVLDMYAEDSTVHLPLIGTRCDLLAYTDEDEAPK